MADKKGIIKNAIDKVRQKSIDVIDSPLVRGMAKKVVDKHMEPVPGMENMKNARTMNDNVDKGSALGAVASVPALAAAGGKGLASAGAGILGTALAANVAGRKIVKERDKTLDELDRNSTHDDIARHDNLIKQMHKQPIGKNAEMKAKKSGVLKSIVKKSSKPFLGSALETISDPINSLVTRKMIKTKKQ